MLQGWARNSGSKTALESFTELMLGRRLLVAAGRTGFARVRGCKPYARGEPLLSPPSGLPPERALVRVRMRGPIYSRRNAVKKKENDQTANISQKGA